MLSKSLEIRLLIFIVTYMYASLACSNVLNSNNIVINLKTSVDVFKSTVMMADIAEISGDNDNVIAKLNTIKVGNAPKPGVPMFVTKDKVVALLSNTSLRKGAHITWGNESVVKIKSHGEILLQEDIISVAERHLEELLETKYIDYKIEQVGVIKDKVVLSGEIRLDPVFDENRDINPRNCVWVDVFVDGNLQSTVHVWFKTKVYADALLSVKSYQKHERIMAENLLSERIDVAGVHGELLKPGDTFSLFRYSKSIEADKVLTYEMIERIPLIEKGSVVIVTANIGKVKIKNKAIAMSDGEMFQNIIVRNRTNSNEYSVLITGDQEVAINAK